MLPPSYRISLQNVTSSAGATFAATVRARRWKYDTDGSLVIESSEATIDAPTGVATGSFGFGTAESNTTTKWLGAWLTITVTPSASTTGSAVVQVQHSTDAGTTWPSNGRGFPLGSAVFSASGAAVTFNAVIE